MKPIEAAKDARRILVIKTSSLGDVCNALPTVDCIKRHFSDATIGWVVKSTFAPIVQSCPYVDHVYAFPRGSLMKALRTGLEVRKYKYDVALDMQGLFVSGLIARLSGAPIRVSYDTRKELNQFFVNYPVVAGRSRDRKAIDIMLDFARLIGVENARFRPQDYLGILRADSMKKFHAGVGGRYVVLFVGATTPQRRWQREGFATVADGLSRLGLGVVFVGSSSDLAATEETLSLCSMNHTCLVGKTDLLELAAVLKEAAVVIGPDSGPLHMAAVMGTPVVGLYGPTDPECTGPYGETARALYVKQPCSPCYRRPTCGGAYHCMKAIVAQEVIDTATIVLRVGAHRQRSERASFL